MKRSPKRVMASARARSPGWMYLSLVVEMRACPKMPARVSMALPLFIHKVANVGWLKSPSFVGLRPDDLLSY